MLNVACGKTVYLDSCVVTVVHFRALPVDIPEQL